MFNPFKKSQPAPPDVSTAMRDTLFGDLPLELWPRENAANTSEPWASFVRARNLLSSGKVSDAVGIWQGIVAQPNLEARHYLQAWHFLRGQGVQPPPPKAKLVYGFVAEVPVESGLDLLAVYADYSARYYNYSGKSIIWEAPDNSLNGLMNGVLGAAQDVASQIGPWEGERPPAPTGENARLNMLTPSGLHFGQAAQGDLMQDPLSAPLFIAAQKLLVALMDKTGA